MKYCVDEPTVSTSFKEKEEKNGTDEGEKDEIIAKLKGTTVFLKELRNEETCFLRMQKRHKSASR